MAQHCNSGIAYRLEVQPSIGDELAAECAKLFSSCYGVWGKGAPADRVGRRAKMSAAYLRKELLFDDHCFASLALHQNRVIGQAICRRFHYDPLKGTIVWILQLVVSPPFRRKGVATNLIRHAVNQPSDVAAGLVSSHPYSIRALESAMNNRVDPEFLTRHAAAIIRSSQIPYTQNRDITGFRINTRFFVDHTEVNAMREKDSSWKLGSLNDGEEIIGIVCKNPCSAVPAHTVSSAEQEHGDRTQGFCYGA